MRYRIRTVLLLILLAVAGLPGCSTPVISCGVLQAAGSLPEAIETAMAGLPGPAPKFFLSTQVFDRSGRPLGEIWQEGHRYWVPLTRIAPALQQATIATEDRTFYRNPGVDWTAIARALVQNQEEGQVVSGGSTITQQLARNIAFPYEKRLEQSLARKLDEANLAQRLAACFSKDDILTMYLNVVYYGHQAYGVEAAARTYFAKPAADLSLAESALLAALPQAPALLDPLDPQNGPAAKQRQGTVLALMVRAGFISEREAAAAFAVPLSYASLAVPAPAPYVLDDVRSTLAAYYGSDETAGRAGLTVTTTVDLDLQQLAEATVARQVAANGERYHIGNAALVALQPATGAVLAVVGGADYTAAGSGQVNVARRPRQPGSAIKPVLYALAFSHGYSPADLLWDVPVEYPLDNGDIYRPRNYDDAFHGPVRLREALANSYNVPAVKLLARLGVPAMLDMAHALGIQGLQAPAGQYGLSLTLGGGEVSLFDLTTAYATLANGGLAVRPTLIQAASDSSGRAVPVVPPANPTRVLDARAAFQVTSILADNAARTPAFGPNSLLRLSRPAAVKTGTTTDWRDNWTVGYTPSLVAGVWAGNNDGSPMRNSSGLTGAAPIWHNFMEGVFADSGLAAAAGMLQGAQDFTRPPGLLDVPVCDLASWHGEAVCPVTHSELLQDPTFQGSADPSPRAEAPGYAALALTAWVPHDPALLMPDPACPARPAALRLPDDPVEAEQARAWAAPRGIALATPDCRTAAVAATAGMAATAQIAAPRQNQPLSGPVEVWGTAVFDAQAFQFYKVEFGYGSNPETWTTMGDLHSEPVQDGRLETFHADALPPGPYALRVVVVRRDGNYLATPPLPVQIVGR